MSIPGIYILGLRQGRGLTRQSIATLTGIAVERQRMIEEGYTAPTPLERIAYARHFGFPTLADFDANWRCKIVRVTRGESSGRIPVINLAPAGEPRSYEEPYPNSGIGYAYINPPPAVSGTNLFAFVIFGDSMEPEYRSGDFAICQPAPADEISEGAAVFVRFGASREHTCTFKRCYLASPLRVELRPINHRYPSQLVLKEDIDRMAKVIAVVPRKADVWPDEMPRPGVDVVFDDPAA